MSECDLWYPNVDEIKLPSVPRENQADVRNILRTALHGVLFELGECWRTSQQLCLSGNGQIMCIEGVYIRDPSNPQCSEEINPGVSAEHAWNTVLGYTVDLTAEFFARSNPADSLWIYEVLKEYTYADVQLHRMKFGDPDEKDISRMVCESMAVVESGEELQVAFAGVTKILEKRWLQMSNLK